jgi:hypothetical protein
LSTTAATASSLLFRPCRGICRLLLHFGNCQDFESQRFVHLNLWTFPHNRSSILKQFSEMLSQVFIALTERGSSHRIACTYFCGGTSLTHTNTRRHSPRLRHSITHTCFTGTKVQNSLTHTLRVIRVFQSARTLGWSWFFQGVYFDTEVTPLIFSLGLWIHQTLMPVSEDLVCTHPCPDPQPTRVRRRGDYGIIFVQLSSL